MEKINAILIFEMLGRPANYLKETLGKFIDRVGKEEGVEILNKKLHDPKKVEDAKQELFTTFAEVEIEFRNLTSLFKIIFVYMPSHIEIVTPKEIGIKNFDLGTITNDLARKLHQYDEIAKKLVIEKQILQKQLQQLQSQISLKTEKKKSKTKTRKKSRSR